MAFYRVAKKVMTAINPLTRTAPLVWKAEPAPFDGTIEDEASGVVVPDGTTTVGVWTRVVGRVPLGALETTAMAVVKVELGRAEAVLVEPEPEEELSELEPLDWF